MAVVTYNIASGQAPFTAQLLPSTTLINEHATTGTFYFENVPNGVYTLRITDANLCVYEKEMTVDPFVTTTTTTVLLGNSIVVGNAQDTLLIFNPDATNRNSGYSGYPDPDIVTLYLWLKTFDGKPLTSEIGFSYNFKGTTTTTTTTTTTSTTTGWGPSFDFLGLSDEIHTEINETASGPAQNISGTLSLKTGFIETYFKYAYLKGSNPEFTIDITSLSGDKIYTNIPTKYDDGVNFGVDTLERDRITFLFD
jgi:hypothetical protein